MPAPCVDSTGTTDTTDTTASGSLQDADLNLTPAAMRLERLRRLRSAWGVLAPSTVTSGGTQISETGREITERLTQVSESDDNVTPLELQQLDAELDQFEASMRAAGSAVPVAELRSSLPRHLASDRPGLLDLLDILIGDDPGEFEKTPHRIGAIDYIITLLCTSADTGGDSTRGSIRHDPVTLTSRIQDLCGRAEEIFGSRFAGVEGEFFAASNMDADDLREEIQLRTLRSRKAELGPAFFVPRILRAVVTYNAALLARVTDEILISGDWGFVSGQAKPTGVAPESACSVFESGPLKEIARAVRRRATGEKPERGPSDQIALALDFEYLAQGEHKALLGNQLGTDADPLGTAILVGLICRSLAVLSIELQAMGISPDEISDHWLPELGEVFRKEINGNISADAYKLACALSELKNKFLSDPLAEQFRLSKTPTAAPKSTNLPSASESNNKSESKETARDLVQCALDEARGAGAKRSESLTLASLPWARITQAAGCALALSLAVMWYSHSDANLARWSTAQLEEVSPFLAKGNRTEAGTGQAFIGTLNASWQELESVSRGDAAEELVNRLHELGITQIMIYDDNHTLRIQALGSQPTRTL